MDVVQWVLKTFDGKIRAIVLGQLRTYSAMGGAALVAHGYASGYTGDQITGALFCLGAVAFSAIDKFVVSYKINAAAETGSTTLVQPPKGGVSA